MMLNSTTSLVDILPFWHFNQDLCVYKDGSLGAGFKLKGIDISCTTDETINEFSQSVENFINSISEGIKVQVFYRLSSDCSDLIQKHQEVSESAPQVYQSVAESRLNTLKINNNNNFYFSPEIHLFVRSKPHKYKKQGFLQKDLDFEKISYTQFKKHKDDFLRDLKQIRSSLDHCNLSPKRINKEEWFKLLFEHFNLSRSEVYPEPKLKDETAPFCPSISEQFNLTDIITHKDCLKIGEYYFRTVTLNTLPESFTYASLIEGFLKLPFHFWLSQNLVVHNQKKEIEKLKLQRRIAHSMAAGSKHVSDIESESRFNHLEQLLSELLEGSEKLVSMDFTVVIWAKDRNELEEKCDEVLKAFKRMNQSEGLVETLPTFDIFLSTAPGPSSGIRYKKLKTSNAVHLMPLFSYWDGNSRPVCLLPNRDNVLVKIDPFSKDLISWNGLVFGSSGSGKSFTLNYLMLQFYGQHPTPKIVWMDNGQSSRGLVESLDGEFIDLDINSDISLNVFDLALGEKEPSPSKVKLILAVLESILKDEERKGLPKRERALLEQAIFEVYLEVRGRFPTLSDLRKILLNHEVPEMRTHAQILYSWCGNTAYGKILDRQTNLSLKKNLTTIETKNLNDFPELENTLLLIFTDFIKRQASEDLSSPYLLIVDEAWKMFQTPSSLAFILEAYRTMRKFNSGIICISQSYSDFLDNQEIRKALYPNTSLLLILKQQVDDWKDFQEKLNLNDAELAIIKSLRIEKGKYSELFLRQNENRAVLRIIPDKLAYWVSTSDPKDKVIISKVRKENPNLPRIEILKKIVGQPLGEVA